MMTDKNLGDAFHYGCALLKDESVDFNDKIKIREALETCAYEMLPIIHKQLGVSCKTNCKHYSGNVIAPCPYRKDCTESCLFEYYEDKYSKQPKNVPK